MNTPTVYAYCINVQYIPTVSGNGVWAFNSLEEKKVLLLALNWKPQRKSQLKLSWLCVGSFCATLWNSSRDEFLRSCLMAALQPISYQCDMGQWCKPN